MSCVNMFGCRELWRVSVAVAWQCIFAWGLCVARSCYIGHCEGLNGRERAQVMALTLFLLYIRTLSAILTTNGNMLRSKRFFSSDALFFAITTLLYVFCLYFTGRNLWATDLWYDEAGQFFISHGLNHWSEPLSSDGNLIDALTANHDYNQDPGGFTALLFFWVKISSEHVWLRLLPFLFFIGTIVFTCLLSFNILRNKQLAYASGLLVFALAGGTFAHELRAYSMELCGLAYGLWMVLRFRKLPSLPQTLAL